MLDPKPFFLKADVPQAAPFMARNGVECNLRAIKFRHGSDDLLPARPLPGAQQGNFTFPNLVRGHGAKDQSFVHTVDNVPEYRWSRADALQNITQAALYILYPTFLCCIVKPHARRHELLQEWNLLQLPLTCTGE